MFLYHSDPVFSKVLDVLPPEFLCVGAVLRFWKMGDCLSWICATQCTCHMIIYFHHTSRLGCSRHMVVVGWIDDGVLLAIPVVVVSVTQAYCLVIGSNRLYLPLFSPRMCMVVVWSRPFPLQVWILVGNIRPAFLWGRYLEQVQSIRRGWSQRWLHPRWGCIVYLCGGPDPACSPW